MKHYTSLEGEKLAIADYIRNNGYVKTSELITWASANRYTNRADRNARQLGSEGFIERISKEDKKRMYGDIREDVWHWVSDYARLGFFESYKTLENNHLSFV